MPGATLLTMARAAWTRIDTESAFDWALATSGTDKEAQATTADATIILAYNAHPPHDHTPPAALFHPVVNDHSARLLPGVRANSSVTSVTQPRSPSAASSVINALRCELGPRRSPRFRSVYPPITAVSACTRTASGSSRSLTTLATVGKP